MPTFNPASATKGALAESDYGGPGEEELTPGAIQEVVIGEGNIGVISNFVDANFSTDGVYSSPSPSVLYNTYDMSYLSSYEIGIACETYPYYAGYDETGENIYVDIYSSVSDFADPTVTLETAIEEAGIIDTEDGTATYSDDDVLTEMQGAGWSWNENRYIASFASAEITGLQDAYGAPADMDPTTVYNSVIETLTLETANTFASKRYEFKYQRSALIRRDNYTTLSPDLPRRRTPNSVTGSASMTSTNAATTTNVGMGY